MYCRLRKTTPPEYPHPHDLLAVNPYTPPATLAQSIMHASPLLSALVVVREWLHDSAPFPAAPGATNGYWRFTRNAVLQGKRTGRMGVGLVDELDPDAASRDAKDGKGLTPDDAVRTTLCVPCEKSYWEGRLSAVRVLTGMIVSGVREDGSTGPLWLCPCWTA